jgi:hypothetical protein
MTKILWIIFPSVWSHHFEGFVKKSYQRFPSTCFLLGTSRKNLWKAKPLRPILLRVMDHVHMRHTYKHFIVLIEMQKQLCCEHCKVRHKIVTWTSSTDAHTNGIETFVLGIPVVTTSYNFIAAGRSNQETYKSSFQNTTNTQLCITTGV